MFGLPLLAVMLGFLSDRSPALLLIAYLPVVPLAAWLEGANAPVGAYGRFAGAGIVTGLVARTLLSTAAILGAASLPVASLLFSVLLPGLLLDLGFLTLAYVPTRFAGWEPQSMTLRSRGWLAR
jgi:hypothetical protein